MRYEFGVGSGRYKLECDDEITAKAAMCFFLKTTAPVAIYIPKDINIITNPQKILDDSYDHIREDTEKFTECLDSIEECDVNLVEDAQ